MRRGVRGPGPIIPPERPLILRGLPGREASRMVASVTSLDPHERKRERGEGGLLAWFAALFGSSDTPVSREGGGGEGGADDGGDAAASADEAGGADGGDGGGGDGGGD